MFIFPSVLGSLWSPKWQTAKWWKSAWWEVMACLDYAACWDIKLRMNERSFRFQTAECERQLPWFKRNSRRVRAFINFSSVILMILSARFLKRLRAMLHIQLKNGFPAGCSCAMIG